MRMYIDEHKATEVLETFHFSPYDEHHGGERTVHKVLRSGFFLRTLFMDVSLFAKGYDQCLRMFTISGRHGMPLTNALVVDIFDILGDRLHGTIPVVR